MENKITETQNILPLVDSGGLDETTERRKEQLEMRLRGFKRKDIVESLTSKYGVSVACIDQDWNRKDSWLMDVVGITDLTGLVGATVGSFNLSQTYRQQILSKVMESADRLVQNGADLENSEALASIWSSMLRILNEIDVAESKKAELLMKLGILREAPKQLNVNRTEVKVSHNIDWEKTIGKMSDAARREFFDAMQGHTQSKQEGEIIDVEGENNE